MREGGVRGNLQSVRNREDAMGWKLLLLLFLIFSTDLSAKDPSSILPGKRIRLKTHPDSSWVEGRLTKITADALVLDRSIGERIHIPQAHISRLEKSAGFGKRVKVATLSGLGGFALGRIGRKYTDNYSGEGGFISPSSVVASIAMIVDYYGAPIGAIIGISVTEWESLSLPLHIVISPQEGGMLALRFEFGR